MKRYIAIGVLALLALASLPSNLAPARAAGHGLQKHGPHIRPFTVWLDWYPNSDHVGIYVALAKGYYTRAGLGVQARVPSGAADALKLVTHGSGDIAISYEPSVLLARAQGLPVVATASIVQQPLNCVLTLKSSGITRPRQLQGKTVGIAGVPSDYTDIAAMVRDDGGDPHKVKPVVVSYALLTGLLGKRVDAIEGAYWTWEALQAEQSGHHVNVMRLDRYGVPSYDELVFATGQAQTQVEAASLRAFQQATFQGYAYAIAHPAEATRILLKAPGVLSSSASLIEHSIRLLSPLFHDKSGHYGVLSVKAWQSYANWLTHNHLTPHHLNAAAALTTTLLP